MPIDAKARRVFARMKPARCHGSRRQRGGWRMNAFVRRRVKCPAMRGGADEISWLRVQSRRGRRDGIDARPRGIAAAKTRAPGSMAGGSGDEPAAMLPWKAASEDNNQSALRGYTPRHGAAKSTRLATPHRVHPAQDKSATIAQVWGQRVAGSNRVAPTGVFVFSSSLLPPARSSVG
jgi:hypothetical protein